VAESTYLQDGKTAINATIVNQPIMEIELTWCSNRKSRHPSRMVSGGWLPKIGVGFVFYNKKREKKNNN
jgi:hypothetical protein